MAVQSLFQDLPQSQGYWNVALHKAAVLFGQLVGNPGSSGFVIPTNTPGSGSEPAAPGFSRVYDYFPGTNNIRTITYQQDAVAIGKVTFTYIALAVADDDLIATEVWTAS